MPYDTVTVRPRAGTRPHPPIYVASTTPGSLKAAARNRVSLQFYHHLPSAEARAEIAEQYRGFAEEADWDGAADHFHTLICVVDDDEAAARERLTEGLVHSWSKGMHPGLAQREAPAGEPEERAAEIVNQSPVGPPDVVAGWLEEFTRATGASKFGLYMEADGNPERVFTSARRFAEEVMPRLDDQARRQV